MKHSIGLPLNLLIKLNDACNVVAASIFYI